MQGMIFGLMAGEISPDIMFWVIRQKMARMGADGCRSVRMGGDACISKEGTWNNTKICTHGCVGQYLLTHVHGNKIRLTLRLLKYRTERAISIILGGWGLHKTCIWTYQKASIHILKKIHEKNKTIKYKLVQHTDFWTKNNNHKPEQQQQEKLHKLHRNKLLLLNKCITKDLSTQKSKMRLTKLHQTRKWYRGKPPTN